jgi:hypothetical protein
MKEGRNSAEKIIYESMSCNITISKTVYLYDLKAENLER